jgi:hypothetical protein
MIRTFLLFTLLALVGCRKPERPEGIPVTSVAVGNAERYLFVNCSLVLGADFDCDVFNERHGQRVATGRFRLLPSSVSFDPHDATEYVDFDGTNIVLTRARRLEVTEPPRPPGVPVTAVWGGGPRCGSFLDCLQQDAGTLYVCSIFQERTGSVASRGQYRLYGTPTGQFKVPCDISTIHRLVAANGGEYYMQEVSGAP